jgi:hypothetical protein
MRLKDLGDDQKVFPAFSRAIMCQLWTNESSRASRERGHLHVNARGGRREALVDAVEGSGARGKCAVGIGKVQEKNNVIFLLVY